MAQPAPTRRPVIEFAQRTDPGRDPNKQVNEDACAYRETRLGHLLVVCDGMGGHAAGQEAARLALSTIFQVVEASPEGSPPGQALRLAITEAGRVVYQFGGAGQNPGRPGSTCVAILIHSAGTEIAHVGDSRAYVIRSGQIWPLTRDHSIVQQMVDAQMLTPEQAYGHPEANKITRALGMRPEVVVESREQPLPQVAGDIFLLASDGLCDLARPEEVLSVVQSSGGVDRACEALVNFANARGGHDNITVQIAHIIDAGAAWGAAAPVPMPPQTQPTGRRAHGEALPTATSTLVSEGLPIPGRSTAPDPMAATAYQGGAPLPPLQAPPPVPPGSYPRPAMLGVDPMAPREIPAPPGSYPTSPGAFPTAPGSYPTEGLPHGMAQGALGPPGSSPTAPDAAQTVARAYPLAPGAYPAPPGSYPMAPGSYPSGSGEYTAMGAASARSKAARGSTLVVISIVVAFCIVAAVVLWWLLVIRGEGAKGQPLGRAANPAPASRTAP
jgi:protein phosphatase